MEEKSLKREMPIQQEPALSTLLNALKGVVSELSQNSASVFWMANALSPIPEEKITEGLAQKEPVSRLDHLWTEVNTLRSINNQMLTIKNHLEKVIGS